MPRSKGHHQVAQSHLRDTDGSHFTRWRSEPSRKQERKTLMDNASVARLYWLLAR